MKTKYFITLLAMSFAMTMSLVGSHAHAGDDVFLDEGDGDFGSIPAPTSGKKDEKVEKTPTAAATKPASASAPAPDLAAPPAPGDAATADTTTFDDSLTEPSATADAPAAAPTKPEKKSHVAHASKTATHKTKVAAKFMTTKDSCPMMRAPASEGSPMIVVKPSRRIWVELVDENWVRGFNKAGEPGYLSKTCFE